MADDINKLPQFSQEKLKKEYPSSEYKILVVETTVGTSKRIDFRVVSLGLGPGQKLGNIVYADSSEVIDGEFQNQSWLPPKPAKVPTAAPPTPPPAKEEGKPRAPGDPPQQFKLAKDISGLSAKDKERLENQEGPIGEGIAGDSKYEPIPTFNQLESETVYGSKTNAQIVMGPYRPGGRFSKRLARGESGISTIDLVAGRLGSYAASTVERAGKETPALVDNNYKVDAARLIICQKGDVDDDFGIRPGKVGTSRARSFVAAKADDIRLSARESIKLVTGTDDENAQGAIIDNPRGIDLIAGNLDHDLQPMIKGSNLIECLEDTNENIAALNGILLDFMTQQMLFNLAVMSHHHTYFTFPGGILGPIASTDGPPTIQSPLHIPVPLLMAAYFPMSTQMTGVTFTSIMSNRLNITRNHFKYLNPKPFGDDKYICSKFNNTN